MGHGKFEEFVGSSLYEKRVDTLSKRKDKTKEGDPIWTDYTEKSKIGLPQHLQDIEAGISWRELDEKTMAKLQEISHQQSRAGVRGASTQDKFAKVELESQQEWMEFKAGQESADIAKKEDYRLLAEKQGYDIEQKAEGAAEDLAQFEADSVMYDKDQAAKWNEQLQTEVMFIQNMKYQVWEDLIKLYPEGFDPAEWEEALELIGLSPEQMKDTFGNDVPGLPETSFDYEYQDYIVSNTGGGNQSGGSTGGGGGGGGGSPPSNTVVSGAAPADPTGTPKVSQTGYSGSIPTHEEFLQMSEEQRTTTRTNLNPLGGKVVSVSGSSFQGMSGISLDNPGEFDIQIGFLDSDTNLLLGHNKLPSALQTEATKAGAYGYLKKGTKEMETFWKQMTPNTYASSYGLTYNLPDKDMEKQAKEQGYFYHYGVPYIYAEGKWYSGHILRDPVPKVEVHRDDMTSWERLHDDNGWTIYNDNTMIDRNGKTSKIDWKKD